MKVVCTECMKMCCLGGKNSVVINIEMVMKPRRSLFLPGIHDTIIMLTSSSGAHNALYLIMRS